MRTLGLGASWHTVVMVPPSKGSAEDCFDCDGWHQLPAMTLVWRLHQIQRLTQLAGRGCIEAAGIAGIDGPKATYNLGSQ